MERIQIFLLLIFISAKGYSQDLDIKILRTINSPEELNADKYFRFISVSEPYIVVFAPVAMASAGLLSHDRQMFRNACVTGVSLILSTAVTNAFKYTIRRDRPFITYTDIVKKTDADSPSFPSGHTSSAFAAATSLSLAYPKWYVILPSYAFAGATAYSRMELGVHYPSDVAAGALIGAGCAYLTFKVNKMLLKNNRKYRTKPCDCPGLAP